MRMGPYTLMMRYGCLEDPPSHRSLRVYLRDFVGPLSFFPSHRGLSNHIADLSLPLGSGHSRALTRPQPQHVLSDPGIAGLYPTPSPSKDNNNVNFGSHDCTPSKPMTIPMQPPQQKGVVNPQWPTPPYEESEWAASAAASIFATQAAYR